MCLKNLFLLISFFLISCKISNTSFKTNKQTNKPIVSFVFDDGWDTDFNVVKPIFDNRDLKCGFAIVQRLVGVHNRMNKEQIKQLNDEGFEILAHSVNHFNMSIDTISIEKIKYEIKAPQVYFKEIECNVVGWVTPMSLMHDTYISNLNDYKYAFTKSNGFNPIEEKNLHRLTRFGLESTTLNKAIETVDLAHSTNKPIVFYAHNVIKDSKEEKDLITLIDYCIKKKYKIVTPYELIKSHYEF